MSRKERSYKSPRYMEPDVLYATRVVSAAVFSRVVNIDDILDREGDLGYISTELERYKKAQENRELVYRGYKIMKAVGCDEILLTKIFAPSSVEKTDQVALVTKTLSQVPEDKKRFMGLKISEIIQALVRGEMVLDDNDEELGNMVQKDGLSVTEYFTENLRVRKAHIDLLTLQKEWLQNKKKQEKWERKQASKGSGKKQEKKQKKPIAPVAEIADIEAIEENISQEVTINLPEVIVEPSPEAVAVVEDFGLADWKLYTTREFWSYAPENLVNVSSNTLDKVVMGYAKVAAGSISVKPQSVVRAVEISISERNILSKSLETRLKFGLKGVTDWIRIKRGHVRIGVFVPDPNKKVAVFFAGPRGSVYDNLKTVKNSPWIDPE